MIKQNFDAVIRQWLDAHPKDRDYAEGALLLLRLDKNQIRYRSISRNPAKFSGLIESELRKHYEKRKSRPSPEQKDLIRQEAIRILKEAKPSSPADFKSGKRGDHDSLPPDIQQLYVDNLNLRRAIQQYHLQVRTLINSRRDCAPEDLRDLCALIKKADVRYHDNWKAYDAYGRGQQNDDEERS